MLNQKQFIKMTTEPNDPAFAAFDQSDGLTKREYFAAMAMQGLLASVILNPLPISVKIQMARESADALIAELNKEVQP